MSEKTSGQFDKGGEMVVVLLVCSCQEHVFSGELNHPDHFSHERNI